MKKILITLFASFFLVACSTGPQVVPSDHLETGPEIQRLTGTVVNIKEVNTKATFGKRFGGAFLGALIGGQIGGGTGKEIAGVTGAFLGLELANDKYGDTIDHVFLKAEDGSEYDCYVELNGFKVGDAVEFTLISGHVSAIVTATP